MKKAKKHAKSKTSSKRRVKSKTSSKRVGGKLKTRKQIKKAKPPTKSKKAILPKTPKLKQVAKEAAIAAGISDHELRERLAPDSEGAMRKARFNEEQMVAVIREADREPVAVVAKRHGISEQTIYTWRKRFGGFQANDIRRLKQLETENARLKKLVVERDLEIEVMKEVAAKNW